MNRSTFIADEIKYREMTRKLWHLFRNKGWALRKIVEEKEESKQGQENSVDGWDKEIRESK